MAHCTCQRGFFGAHCESHRPCNVYVCQNNATCVYTPRADICYCRPGFSGQLLSIIQYIQSYTQLPLWVPTDARGLHSFVCKTAQCRSARHHALNDLVARSFASAGVPGLLRTDGKRPDGVSLVPWQSDKSSACTVTVYRRVNHLGKCPRFGHSKYSFTYLLTNQPPRSTQPGHPSVGRRNEYQRKLGPKQAHRAMH